MLGTTLNHYRVTNVVGSGGMGDVYAAEDTKLHRQVAIKVLPPDVADDADRRQRFEREAHAIAALNHPNIVTIFSIEQSGNRLFLTMELVSGQPLSQLIRSRGLPLDRLLTLAIPLADAVSAAHQQGIIHRDLKPDNIMVTGDGRLKVLDFGLARLKEVAPTADAVTAAPAAQLTGERSIVGTVAYMSPEQAEGRSLDQRSDIFSLGIVLYEMATGERPFKGDTPLSILSSIVKDPAPAVTGVYPSLPREFARIVRRCLVKDPARRYQTTADVRNDLADLEQELDSVPAVGSGVPHASGGRWRERVAWSAAALLLATTLIAWFHGASDGDRSVDVLSVLSPDHTALTEGEAPQMSPDGRALAFVATDASGRTLLYVRERSSLVARPLVETDDATQPFWSPDGRSIGFFANGLLKRVPVSGGRPQTLAVAPVPRGGTWSRDGVIVFVPFPEQPPHRIPAAGGTATPLSIPARQLRWFPSFLPDGRRYIHLAPGQGIQIASLDSTDTTPLVPSTTSASYLDPGYLIYRREESLVAQRLNPDTSQIEGSPITLVERVSFNPITAQALFSASTNGALAYLAAGREWQLTWFDRSGRRLTRAGAIGGYNSLCLLSDDQRLVYDLADTRSGDVDLWSLSLSDGTSSRLTFERVSDFYAACSSSSDDVVFASVRGGTPNLYRLTASAPGGERPLLQSPLPSLPTHWSTDGRFVVYSAFSPKTNWDIWILPLAVGKPSAYLATDAEEKNAHMSPDIRWIAYTSSQAGTEEVYVQPFPATGARWQISRGGGRQPQWRPDGRQLFYISLEKKLMAVDVEASASTFVHGPSRILIDTQVGGGVERTHQGNPYAVSADGERFLIANAGDETLPITVVLHWPFLVGRSPQ